VANPNKQTKKQRRLDRLSNTSKYKSRLNRKGPIGVSMFMSVFLNNEDELNKREDKG